MEPTESATRTDQNTIFLLDGLSRAPSPVLLVVCTEPVASGVALAVHNGSADWEDRPARVGKLLRLDLEGIAADPAADFSELLAELAGTDHWVYLPDVDSLLESVAGLRFLDGLMNSVSGGEVAAVIASTMHERLPELNVEVPRLAGFATALHGPGSPRAGELTYSHTIAVSSNDPADVGWVVAVRYELTATIEEEPDPTDLSFDGRLQLVDKINMIVRDGEPPLGVLISLTPDAFTVGQADAVFATAALAAQRLVGRPLDPTESVIAARAIYFG